AAADLLQAAVEVFAEVALRRAQGDAGEVGDLLVRQAVTLQPQHLHLALHVWVRVVVALAVYRLEVFVGEGELSHRRRLWCRVILLPGCRLWRFTSTAQTCQSSPRGVEITYWKVHNAVARDQRGERLSFPFSG